MRVGGERFLDPAEPAQRRYEALRAYVVEQQPAASVAARFGYSAATVRQMAVDWRAGRLQLFVSSKPGPKGPRKQPQVRDRVLVLRAQGRSVTDIAEAITAEGSPVSHDTVWQILRAEGLERLPATAGSARASGAPPRAAAPTAQALVEWPAGAQWHSEHAGLWLLLPALVDLGVPDAIGQAGYPSTEALSAWHSVGALLLAKLARRGRINHVDDLVADPSLGLMLGLSALPKTTHLSSYSYRVRREANHALLAACARRLVELGNVTGAAGFNLDFHAIRHHGDDPPLDKNYVPKRSQATRSVLSFFAQDHASQEMVYANADVTKTEQAREVLAFVDYWRDAAGADPQPLVFDARLTTYAVLDELGAQHITWLTLRQRGRAEIQRLQALPDSAWTHVRLDRAGSYRRPQLHDELVHLKGISYPVRQVAVRNIGRDEPTLLITNDHTSTAKQLFARYAERMLIENELAYLIAGFHLDALSADLALNVDLDTTLTVAAANTYRLFARGLPRYERAQPERLHRDFTAHSGTITVTDDHVTVALNPTTYSPVLLDAGYTDLDLPIPWWNNRTLRFTLPPR